MQIREEESGALKLTRIKSNPNEILKHKVVFNQLRATRRSSVSITPLSSVASATSTQNPLFSACRRVQGDISRVAGNLAASLGQYLKQVSTGKSVKLEPGIAQKTDLERGSSVDSGFSSLDAHTFRQIHEDAALRVIQTLKKLHDRQQTVGTRPASATFPACLNNLKEQVQRLDGNSLATESVDVSEIREVIGGKTKSFRPTLKGFQYWKELRSVIRAGKNGTEMPGNLQHVHLRVALAAYIRGALDTAKFGEGIFSLRTLDDLIASEVVKGLNRQDWGTIETNNGLTFKKVAGETQTVQFKTTMVPASELSSSLARSYKASDLKGVCSYATQEGQHSVNLWQTKFEALDTLNTSNQLEKSKLFSGVRHGVHDAYGHGKDDYSRAKANDGRIKEFTTVCLIDQMEKIQLSDDELNGRAVVDLPVVSVNLLTPFGKEKSMIHQQTAALERAHEKIVWVEVDRGPGLAPYRVKVRPRFVSFNLPVNHVSLGQVAKPLGIWASADKMNEAGLHAFIGSTEEKAKIGGIAGEKLEELAAELSALAKRDLPPALRDTQRAALIRKTAEIKTLVEQVRGIVKNKDHHRVGQEPYKLPVRLLALANECDAVPAFNCKSGKDRTGQLNVEIRDFYAHYHGTGRLRAPDSLRTEHARQNYQSLFADGGDREIQKLNTSVPGSKSQLPYYNHLLGVQPETMDAIKGLSKWIGT